MKVLFRTCGGLGNQIFQYFFLFCILEKYKSTQVVHYHSVNYDRIAEHEFPYDNHLSVPSLFDVFLIKLRLLPLFRALGFKNLFFLKFGDILIVDGYYQSKESYFIFSKIQLHNSFSKIREVIFNDFTKQKVRSSLFHLRIGDFFNSISEERSFIIMSLKHLDSGTFVISNNDELIINDLEIQEILSLGGLIYIKTFGFTALQLLELFCGFERIKSSGSSLSFAAAIFSDVDINMNIMLSGNPLVYFNNLLGLKKHLLCSL